MLALNLADSIDASDPCTPGSPSYNPNDPICALTAPTVAADTTSSEISFDLTSCPTGYTLDAVNGVCNWAGTPGLQPAKIAATPAIAAGLFGLNISWGWLALLAVLGGGTWYGVHRYTKKHKL